MCMNLGFLHCPPIVWNHHTRANAFPERKLFQLMIRIRAQSTFDVIVFNRCPRSPWVRPLIARFMEPTCGPSGADRTRVGPMLVPWTFLSRTAALTNTAYDILNGTFDTPVILHISLWESPRRETRSIFNNYRLDTGWHDWHFCKRW